MAWRWNLDYVTDSHGDAMACSTTRDQLLRRRTRATTGTASYVQAGALSNDRVRAAGRRVLTGDADHPRGVKSMFTTAAAPYRHPPADLAVRSGASCDVSRPRSGPRTG